jgi:hypothetical protein
MPGRIKRQPSGRNLELYFELICEGRPQVELVVRFRVSEARVCQLRRQVAAWVDGVLPDEAAAALPDAARRLHLAVALRRAQLHAAYAEYLEHFGGAGGAVGWGHLLAARDMGILPTGAVRLRPRKLIETAVRMAQELTDLDQIASRGPLANHLDPT